MNNTDLIAEAWAVIDRLFTRLGTQSSRRLDVDACVVLTKLAEALQETEQRSTE